MAASSRRRASRNGPRNGRLPGFVSRQVVSARRWFLNLRPSMRRGSQPDFRVVCGGCERVRGDYCVDRQDFPYLCIEFVAAGRGTLTLCGREHDLAPGTVFAYGPGIPHVIRTDPRLRLRKYYVDFVGRDAPARMQAARLPAGGVLRVPEPEEVVAIFDLLQQCGLAHFPQTPALCGQLLGVLLATIAKRGLQANEVDPKALETYRRFRAFLTRERLRLSSVAQAAHECRISAAYACRLFRRFDTTTPYQYLLRERMNLATDLLASRQAAGERLLVREVAEHLGFADPYQFSRVFKRVFGISPARFQRETAGG